MECSTLGSSVLHYLLEFAQIHVHWIDETIQPCYPLLLPSLLPSVFPSIRVFSNESSLHIKWPKFWSFSFNTSPSNAHSGLISFRMDWFDLLAVQETLKILLQYKLLLHIISIYLSICLSIYLSSEKETLPNRSLSYMSFIFTKHSNSFFQRKMENNNKFYCIC